jgi:hypothetical protein
VKDVMEIFAEIAGVGIAEHIRKVNNFNVVVRG